MKPVATYTNFEALDIRIGRVIRVEDAQTRKPTYRITVDFGSPVGTKVSCGAYKSYSKDELLGKQVVAVINFGPKKMGPEISECLILGVPNETGETIYLKPERDVQLGVEVF